MRNAYLLSERDCMVLDTVREWEARSGQPVPHSLLAVSLPASIGPHYLKLALRDLAVNGWLRVVDGGYRDGRP